MTTINTESLCPVWPQTRVPCTYSNRDKVLYQSPRAGGDYIITGTAHAILDAQPLTKDHAIRLTSHLVQQRRAGIEQPIVDSELLRRVGSIKRPRPLEMPDLFLQFLDANLDELDQVIPLKNAIAESTTVRSAMAWTGCNSIYALDKLRNDCQDRGWVERHPGGVQISFNGYARLEEINSTNQDSSMCFVAMWFDSSVRDAYDNGIAKGIEDAGYDPFIVNQQEHSDKIDDFIIASIRRSRFVVADFTSEIDKPRGGVYYEAGFAQGLGLPVIWTVRADMIKNIHFDTRQYNHITWTDPDDLRKQLSVRISAVIGDGPNKTT